jgi:flagella basal body P-ring formation protein FlgA
MYQVKITEILTMTVEIEAENESSAEQQIKDRWKNSEYVKGYVDTDGNLHIKDKTSLQSW